MADHSQASVTDSIALQDELFELGVLGPARPARGSGRSESPEPRIAVCPSQRAAMVYALHEAERDAMRASVTAMAMAIEGVDLVMWLERDAHEAPREGVIASPAHGELRFAPGGAVLDPRGESWSVEGALGAIDARIEDGVILSPSYPDALAQGLVGARRARPRGRCCCRRPRLRVHRLGTPGPRRRRQSRLAARLRLARRARDDGPRGARARSHAVGDHGTSRRWS